MEPTIWMRISYVLRANESLAWWRARMEVAFDAVRPLLRPCPGLRAKGYLCPDSGTRLMVRERKRGGYVAFATGKDAGYFDDQYLEWADVQAWRLDEGALVEAVAGALGIEGGAGTARSESTPYPVAMLELGVCRRGGGRRRVLMCLEPRIEAAIPAVCGIGEGDGVGCVLMPKRFAGVRELLRMKGATELLMPECLRVEGDRIVGDCGGACMPAGGAVGRENRFPSGNRSYNGEAPDPGDRAYNGRDMSVREAVAHFDGRIDQVGQDVVGRIGDKLDRGFEQVMGVRQADVERIQMQRETIEDMAQGVDKFLAGLQGRLSVADQRLFFELIGKTEAFGVQRVRSYSEIGKRLGGVSKQAVGNKVRDFLERHPEVKDFVLETRSPEKPVNFSELSPLARRKAGIDSSYDHSVT